MASITDVSSRSELLKYFGRLEDSELKHLLSELMLVDQKCELTRPELLEFLGMLVDNHTLFGDPFVLAYTLFPFVTLFHYLH